MNSHQLANQYGMPSVDEIGLLQECVLSLTKPRFLNPITVVNIGANIGTSSCAMLEAKVGVWD